MKCLLTLVVLCSLSSAQTPTENLHDSGNAFLRVCAAVEKVHDLTVRDVENQEASAGYLSGFSEGIAFAAQDTRTKTTFEVPYCAKSEEAEAGQLVKIVLKYIREHPEEAHLRTYLLVGRALQKAFPCGG
jgi:hypothetical protein